MNQSDHIKNALHESFKLSNWINERWPTQFTDFKFDRFAVAFFSIAQTHRDALLALLAMDNRTSAFALARPVFEAVVRGFWAKHCATAQDMDRANENGALPTIETMMKALRKTELGEPLSAIKALVWKALSDFSHGDLRQVTNWLSKDGVGPVHPDREVLELISTVNVLFLLGCVQVMEIAKADSQSFLIKIQSLVQSYKKDKYIDRISGGLSEPVFRDELL